ncbi:DUF7882 family protein [Leucobacter japonicus]|uniref:DUF7882 family protein n=1 Tax=Leucobacter japonicus TaxID=1461259 RepID=UPI0006A76F25|nr:hypothetical protein [Leucobacter japonicus]
MGYLVHGRNEYAFDDRVLAHLKLAIAQKLRQQESFFVSWAVRPEEGSGRVSLWLSPSADLAFHFFGSKPPEINVAWVKALAATSHSVQGIRVMSEHDAEQFAAANPDLV